MGERRSSLLPLAAAASWCWVSSLAVWPLSALLSSGDRVGSVVRYAQALGEAFSSLASIAAFASAYMDWISGLPAFSAASVLWLLWACSSVWAFWKACSPALPAPIRAGVSRALRMSSPLALLDMLASLAHAMLWPNPGLGASGAGRPGCDPSKAQGDRVADMLGALGLDAMPSSPRDLRRAWIARLAKVHPDRPGGSHIAAAKANEAYSELRSMLR